MKLKKTYSALSVIILTLILLTTPAGAQEKSAANDAAQANNPLANMTAVNLHNYYIGELTESDEDANQFWLRFAKPFSISKTNWILRASLPLNSFPTPPDNDKETGLGDFNVMASYLVDTGNPKVSFGIGLQLTMPTATEDALGSEKWSAGLANLYFNAKSPKYQFGYLLTWQHSFAGESDRADVNAGAFQPFFFYQLGKGLYLRCVPICSYNFEDDTYSVPLGLGIGQVIPVGKTVFNLFIEPQYSILDDGPGWPEWQIFFGLNMQFKS